MGNQTKTKANFNFMELLTKAFDSMPDVFTSSDFTKAAIKAGYPKELTIRKGLGGFLMRFADNGYEFSKTWTKKTSLIKPEKKKTVPNINNEIESAISLLKANGYKVLRPINEFIEC